MSGSRGRQPQRRKRTRRVPCRNSYKSSANMRNASATRRAPCHERQHALTPPGKRTHEDASLATQVVVAPQLLQGSRGEDLGVVLADDGHGTASAAREHENESTNAVRTPAPREQTTAQVLRLKLEPSQVLACLRVRGVEGAQP